MYSQFDNKWISTDIIIVPPNFSYTPDLRSSPRYRATDINDNQLQFALYNGIPVVRMFAKGLNLKAIVSSFKVAMLLTTLENDELFDRLHLILRELIEQEIDFIIKSKPRNERLTQTINSCTLRPARGRPGF